MRDVDRTPYVSGVILGKFGAADDVSHTGFSPGLNVISGRNEAGKSTLRNAIPAALMGWPSARGGANNYQRGSSRRKVTILFTDGEHRFVFTRDASKVSVTRDGIDMDPEEFADRYLAGVDGALYRTVLSIDAFTAPEIATSTELSDSFMMAGSGAALSPVKLQNDLRKELKSLFTTDNRMQNVLIRNLTTELRATEARILELRTEAHDLNEDALRLSNMDTELEESARELEWARNHEASLRTSLQRFERLEVDSRSAASAVREAQERLASSEDEARLLPQDEDLIEALPVLERYNSDVSLMATRLEELETLQQEERELMSALPAGAPQLSDEPQVVIDRLQKLELARQNAVDAELEADARVNEARIALEVASHASGLEDDLEQLRSLSVARQRPFFIAAGIGMLLALASAVLGWWIGNVALYVVAGILAVGVFIALVLGALRSEKKLGNPAELTDRIAARDRARKELAYAERILELKRSSTADLETEVRTYLTQQGIAAEGGDLHRALIYATTARDFAHRNSDLTRHRDRIVDLNERIETWMADVSHDLRQIVDSSTSSLSTSQIVDLIPTQLTHAREQAENRRLRLDLMKRIDVTRTELTRAEERLTTLNSEIEEVAAQLELPIGEDAHVALSSRIREAHSHVTTLDAKHDALNSEHGMLRERIRSADIDARLNSAVQEAEDLRTRIQDARERYVSLAVKSQLLDDALTSWSQEQKPGIDSAADAYLADLTDGRWTRIISENGSYSVLDHAGNKLEDRNLSSGTQAQMHLALRLALIESSPDLAPAAPVLMDDILVHFDDTRKRHALNALQRLARTRQVMYFTHDAQLAQTMEEAGAYHKQLG